MQLAYADAVKEQTKPREEVETSQPEPDVEPAAGEEDPDADERGAG